VTADAAALCLQSGNAAILAAFGERALERGDSRVFAPRAGATRLPERDPDGATQDREPSHHACARGGDIST